MFKKPLSESPFISETILHDSLIPQHKSDPIPSSFWSVYERVAKQHDEDFLEMHYNNLDVILIYVCITLLRSTPELIQT